MEVTVIKSPRDGTDLQKRVSCLSWSLASVELTDLLDACGLNDFSGQKIIGLQFLAAIFPYLITMALMSVPCARAQKKRNLYSVDLGAELKPSRFIFLFLLSKALF